MFTTSSVEIDSSNIMTANEMKFAPVMVSKAFRNKIPEDTVLNKAFSIRTLKSFPQGALNIHFISEKVLYTGQEGSNLMKDVPFLIAEALRDFLCPSLTSRI